MCAVFSGDVAVLQQDDEFVSQLRRGMQLLALSWAWDTTSNKVSHRPSGEEIA
jgi:hypothetical protein